MKINFIYRSAPGDSKKEARPVYFDKKNCLISFLQACKKLPLEFKGELIFINDGEIDTSLTEVMAEMDGTIETLPGLGNSPSLRFAHEKALSKGWDENDIVYFAEDDYLYKEDAFLLLAHAVEDISEAHYFTLYDHPDRYIREDDINNGLSKIYISRDCHWRMVESTCQSFGVRLKTFKKDRWIHKLGTSFKIPRGREIFRAVQGIGKYFWKFPKHPVVSPMPSYATHMEKKHLAKNVDWQAVNESADIFV